MSTVARPPLGIRVLLLTIGASAALAFGGCGRPPGGAGSAAPVAGRVTVVTEAEIARMSVRTAWDVVRLRAPRLFFGVDETGRPARVRIQEPRSVNSDETPLLVVDGVPMFDLEYLNQIPATEIQTIRILDTEAAEPLYGLRAAGGAIVVETKHRQ